MEVDLNSYGWSIFLIKMPRYINGVIIVFLTWNAYLIGHACAINNDSFHIRKIISKWIIGLFLGAKVTKFSEENVE